MDGPVGVGHGGAEAGLRGDSAEAADHGGNDLRGSDAALKTIGIGKEIAFQAAGLGIEIGDQGSLGDGGGQKTLPGDVEEAGLDDPGGDVETSGSLGNGYCQGVDVAAGDSCVDFRDRRGVVEAVFASF